MNSFLFTAFGEQFATHENVFPYSHPHHDADIEHNIIIVDEGGMPAADRPNSAGDDGSLFGFMTGAATGHFADYARGDARASYADRSIRGSLPAVRAERRGVRVRYLAVAAANRNGEPEPRLRPGPEPVGAEGASSIVVEGNGFVDLIVWQPEETADAGGRMITCGQLKTDALLAMVRTSPAGKVLGYVLGDGSVLEFAGSVLARSTPGFSVSADSAKAMACGKRRARQNLPPLPASGDLWLPGPATRVWIDGAPVTASRGGLFRIGPKPGR